MAKQNRDKVIDNRKNKKRNKGREINEKFQDEVRAPVTAKNNVQKQLLAALASDCSIVVFEAPSGVGKSFVTMSEVSDWLKKGITNKIVLTRPSVGMGNTIGLLKGDLRDKFEPYLMPLLSVIKDRYGSNWYENNLSNGNIQILPLEYVRGASIDAVVVADEMQNAKPDEMYTLVTRMAEGGKLIILGDRTQNDLKGQTGIEWLVEFAKRHKSVQQHITVIQATSDDIVRGGLCKSVVKAREKDLNV